MKKHNAQRVLLDMSYIGVFLDRLSTKRCNQGEKTTVSYSRGCERAFRNGN